MGVVQHNSGSLTQPEPPSVIFGSVTSKRLLHRVHEIYGAPSIEAALPDARDEIAFMAELCEDQPENTLLDP